MEVKYKLILIGDTAVGKTCLLKRKKENIFDSHFTSTIGVDFCYITLNKNNTKIKVYIWDTAGQEKFSNLINVYFRDIDGAMILYDISSKKSFDNTKKWIEKIKFYNPTDLTIMLVGTKSDLENKRDVDKEEVSQFVREHNLLHSTCSSKDNINIIETFDIITDEMYNKNPKKKKEYIDINTPLKKNCCSIL